MELNDTNRYPFVCGYLSQAIKDVLDENSTLDELRVVRLVCLEVADRQIHSTDAVDRRWRELRAQGKVTG